MLLLSRLKRFFNKPHLRLIALVGVIVPRRLRADWRQEWEAELRCRETLLAKWNKLNWQTKLNLLWRSTSAFWDALWLQPKRLEDEMFQDLRFGVRMLLKSPGFSVVTILLLALGIGANTLIFSVVNTLLLRPLPFHEADRVVALAETAADGNPTPVAPANLNDWRQQSRAFASLAAFEFDGFNLARTEQPESFTGAWISPEFFDVLSAQAALGRLSVAPEEAGRAVVLSHGLWQRRFGADPQIIGRQVGLYAQDNPQTEASFTVVGVLPANFWFVSGQFQVWIPRRFTPEQLNNRAARSQQVIARLKAGVTPEQAQTEMQAIAGRLAQAYPQTNERRGVNVVPLQERLLSEVGAATLLLLGAVCFVLLIACANVANLLLARAAIRQKEIAIRAALGASRLRIVQQLLTESVLLAGLGGAAGLLLAYWGIGLVVALIPAEAQSFIPGGAQSIAVDWHVLGFTVSASVLTGIVFGLAPALAATKLNLNVTLKAGGHTSQSAPRQRVRNLLVIAEVALSLVLLMSTGLMLKSFAQMQRADLGFNPDRVLKVEIPLPQGKYPDAARQTAFFQQTLDRVAALPGIEAVSLGNNYPLRMPNRVLFTIEGRATPAPDNLPAAADIVVSPAYFQTIGVPLRAGRAFTERDVAAAPPVVIISETTARRFFPGADALGKRLRLGGLNAQTPWVEIVGVVPDIRQELSPEPVFPALYRPFAQAPQTYLYLLARTTAEPASQIAAVRQAIAAVDQDQPLAGLASMSQVVTEAAWGTRFFTLLLGVFGLLALVMAVLGIYGVIAYSVTQRTPEIGLRLALGAQPADVLKLIVRQGMKLVLIGSALGALASLALMQLLKSLLFGVSATDPLVFVAVSLALLLAALLACLLPARRAAQIDPMVALRQE